VKQKTFVSRLNYFFSRAAELHPALLDTVSQVIKELSDEKKNAAELPSGSLSLEAALANHTDMQEMDAVGVI